MPEDTSLFGLDPAELKHLLLSRRGVAAVVTLNRPEVHNAFNAAMIAELRTVFERLSAIDDIRAVVLQGAGRNFCAGADLNWMRASINFTHDENVNDAVALSNMFLAINSCRHPVVGRIHGAALAGGTGLAAVCDIAIATEDARFGFTEARLGIAPAVISQFVVPKIGQSARPRALRHRRAFRRRPRAGHRAGTRRRAGGAVGRGRDQRAARDRAEWAGRGARGQVHGAQRERVGRCGGARDRGRDDRWPAGES